MAEFNPTKELRVLWIVKELGLASIEEISQRYSALFNETCENVNLIIRRWKARKALTIEDGRYKLADIPPWFKSLNQAQLLHLGKGDTKNLLKDLEATFVGEDTAIGTPGKWRDYKKLTFEFEALDPILGGLANDGDEKLTLPRDGDRLIVPKSWLKGMIRDNQALFNVAGLQHHIGWGKGIWDADTKTITLKSSVHVKGRGVGQVIYEAVPKGSKFTVPLMWPMRGCVIDSVEKIQEFFDVIAETAVRGLGANPNAYGGRIKLLKVA